MENDSEKRTPFSDRICAQWEDVHEQASRGIIREREIFSIEADVAEQKRRLAADQTLPSERVYDILYAESMNNYHYDRFTGQRRYYQELREYFREHSELVLNDGLSFNQFVVRTLVYGNGAAALGALAYMGSDGGKDFAAHVSVLIGICAAGFFLALASAYALARLNVFLASKFRAAAFGSTSDSDLQKLATEKQSTLLLKIPPALGWLSAGCLLAACVMGFFVFDQRTKTEIGVTSSHFIAAPSAELAL